MSPIPDDPNQAQAWISGEAPDQTIDFYIPRGNRGPIGPTGPQGPSLLVGTVETTTGPAVPGTIGPTGLTGPKGDPGGISVPTLLSGAGANLNNVATPGLFVAAGSDMTAANNWPMDNTGGILQVFQWSTTVGYVMQMFWPRGETSAAPNNKPGSRGVYVRTGAPGGLWSVWSFTAPQRVDQTAGRAIYQWDPLNGREQLIYGDTGWRVLTPQNGWTASQLQIRRNGQMVQMLALQVNGAAATTDAISEVLPVGFRANNWPISLRVPITTGTGVITSNVAAVDVSTQALRVFGGNHTLLTAHHIITSWLTNDTWPTTLPGTASGSIPNT